MATLSGFAQFKHGAAGNDFAAMTQKRGNELLQVQQLRPVVDQGHHVHAEGVLHLRHLVEIIQHDLRDFATLQLDHGAHTGFIRLIAQIGNAFEFLVSHQFADLDEQVGFVYLVRQLINDDGLAATFFQIFKVGSCTHDASAATGSVAFPNAIQSVNDPGSREIRGLHDCNEFFDVYRRIFENLEAGIDDVGKIVRRYIGGHTNSNTGRPIHQQIRKSRRKN